MINSCQMIHDVDRIQLGVIEERQQETSGEVYYTRKITLHLKDGDCCRCDMAFTLFADSREALSLVA